MQGKLWCLRMVLLFIVSAVIFSPLAVRGASTASQPAGWDHGPSTLLLPSSPAYPAVTAYRDIRMRIAEQSIEKARLSLEFANQDAAAICTMARRQDFLSSANHSFTYLQTFAHCVDWLQIANQHGSDVYPLLAKIKNDHIAQQVALNQAMSLMPDWSGQSLQSTRQRAAELLTEIIRVVEGGDAAQSYVAIVRSSLPDLEIDSVAPIIEPPAVTPTAPKSDVPVDSQHNAPVDEAADGPNISSLYADKLSVPFGALVQIECELSPEIRDDMRFLWWCSQGDLAASRTRAAWTAPHRAGMHEISVTVVDEQGRSDSHSIAVEVIDSEDGLVDSEDDAGQRGGSEDVEPAVEVTSPEIQAVTVTSDHDYLRPVLGGSYSILVSRECTITCSVANPGELDIDWNVTGGGRIYGTGDTVIFKAPATEGDSTVTVTVTNRDGQQDSATIRIHTSDCSYCF